MRPSHLRKRYQSAVLFLNHTGRIAGAERSLLETLRVIDRTWFRPIVACPGDGPLLSRVKALGVETRNVPMLRFRRTFSPLELSLYGASLAAVVARLAALCAREEIRLIHSNSTTAHIYGSLAAAICRIACIRHARDLVDLGALDRTLSLVTDRTLAISEAVRQSVLKRSCRRAEVSVIHNGIDAAAFAESATEGRVRKELQIAADVPVAVMAAQMVPWKGHRDFIMAVARVPRLVGLIAGSDLFGDHSYLRPSLESVCRALKISDRVKFLGQRDDVQDVLADADVVVIPSHAEPFGRVALEAMVLARPVVGTNAGGLPEVVRDGETGILVPPRSPGRLAAAIAKLLEDKSLAERMGRAGRKRVMEMFDIKDKVRELELLYTELIEKGRQCA